MPFEEVPGEAAFYGPKIDVQIVDSVGREWTLATVQVDFHQPVAFNLSYVDADAAVVGAREAAAGQVSLRPRGGGAPRSWSVAEAVSHLVDVCAPPRLSGL